ncbi:MAG: hypothetical protein ACP5QA_14510, partial [Phycisphaerae bacterium]
MTRQNIIGKLTLAAGLAVGISMGVIAGNISAAVTLPTTPSTGLKPVTAHLPVLNQDILMPRSPAPGNPAVATVNGVALSKEHFLNSLLRLNGLGLLEKWIQLTVLKQACVKAGLHVGKAQIDAAEQGVLNQLAAQHIPAKQRIPVLEKLLARKGESLAEFRMALARTTYMLALAKGHVHITNADVELAYKTNFGPKVEVRDIMVSSFDDAATVRHLIMDKHENPAVVAQQHSINTQNAANGEDTRDSRLLNPGCALRGALAGQVVVSFRGLPGGSARRRRPTSFSNLLMVLSPASGLPVCVARRRVVMSLESSACR